MTRALETLLYTAEPPVATLTPIVPNHLDTIVPPMPDETEAAIGVAEPEPEVTFIVPTEPRW